MTKSSLTLLLGVILLMVYIGLLVAKVDGTVSSIAGGFGGFLVGWGLAGSR